MPFFFPFKHFFSLFIDHKIRRLSGEFRCNFGPWGAGNLNEPIFKGSKDRGLPRGGDVEALK